MREDNRLANLYDELKKIIDTTGIQDLLTALKEKARNVDFSLRREFENALLAVVPEANQIDKRNILYETLASLAAVWHENKPKKGLTKTFWKLYEAGKYEEARQIYGELLKQGLDHIDDFEIEAGTLLPCFYKEKPALLKYNDRDISILSPQLEIIKKVVSFEDAQILDVLPPTADDMEDTAKTEVDQKLWVLIRKNKDEKTIISKNIDDGVSEGPSYHLGKEQSTAVGLSCFQGRLLLICPGTIFRHCRDSGWKEWVTPEVEVTCTARVKDAYWVGFSDGTVYLQKDIERTGLRKRRKLQPDIITGIGSSDRFAAVSSLNFLSITDFEGTAKHALKMESNILQTLVLSNDLAAVLQVNGIITGIDVNQGQSVWQINLDKDYNSVFKVGRTIYCAQKDGNVRLFELPDFFRMADLLERENIQAPERPVEREPTEPVRYITEFIGRKELLKETRKTGKLHFLVFGEPKIGKTSLLNVLPEVLSDNARGCYIDIEQLLAEVHTYEAFESRFIEMCLSQHVLKKSDIKKIDGHQPYREMVDKIRGEKNFCLLCLDDFIVPPADRYSKKSLEKFGIFFKEMFTHANVRMAITAGAKDKQAIENYLENLRLDTAKHGGQKRISLPVLSENEVKNALRTKHRLTQKDVEEIYKYVGNFPNHIHLYDKWKKEEKSIAVYSEEIAKNYWDKIFDYFRDLSRDAYLLISLCLNQDLISIKIGFKKFYESYPLLNQLLPGELLKKALGEIDVYGKGFTTNYQEDGFSINMRGKVQLFHEASKHIPWLKVFLTLCRFTSGPNQKRADEVAGAYSKMVNIGLGSSDLLGELTHQYKETFYIRRLTREGQKILGMPLVTFLVIPLKPWDKGRVHQDFTSLYISIQEFVRRAKESMLEETVSLKFYILLFELHGIDLKNIKKSIKGLERVSVIDSNMMTDILFDATPRIKSSEYIFSQLNISERSPYTTSGAVPDELFFGRELEIALIRGLAENIGIFGTRTIGKTSLLLRIQKDIKGQKGWKVFVLDCSRIDDKESLLMNIAEKMGVQYDMISDMDKFRKYVSAEAQKNKIQYLFLLDEVDRLVEYDTESDERIFKTFNKMCTESLESVETAARFILFGFQQMFEQMKNPGSRLYNFMVFLPLKALDEKSALALVTQPMKNIHVNWQSEEDAGYLVDKCSGHPLLLQAACQSLLSILDGKGENKDMIEKRDVDSALYSDQFQHICMRFYPSPPKETQFDNRAKKKNKGKKKFIFPFTKSRVKPSLRPPQGEKKREAFLDDIHRIAILTAIRLQFEKYKENFALTDLQDEFKRLKIEISPNMMRNILDHLCLSGVFRLLEESTLITREKNKIQEEAQKQIDSAAKHDQQLPDTSQFKIEQPEELRAKGKSLLKFKYEFGVQIFPELLVANLGGIEKCSEELSKLIEKGEWKEWIGRH